MAKSVLFHELLHRQLRGDVVAGWICHRGQDPDDVWVIDIMSNGQHVRLGEP